MLIEKFKRLPAIVLMGLVMVMLSACGGESLDDKLAACQKECDEINRDRNDNRTCFGCTITTAKPTLKNAENLEIQATKQKMRLGENLSVPLSYSGLNTMAVIDESNAQELAIASWQGGSANLENLTIKKSRPLLLSQLLKRILLKLDHEILLRGPSLPEPGPINTSSQGSCGGEAFYEKSKDENMQDYMGKIDFSGYCEEGEVLNGMAEFSMNKNTESTTVGFSFQNLQLTTTTDSFTSAGNVSIRFFGQNFSKATMNILIAEDSTGKVYMLKEYELEVSEETNYTEIYITNGIFFDPNHGYVQIFTKIPFGIHHPEEWPSSGELTAIGKNGNSASLTAYTSTSCMILMEKNLNL